MAGQCITYDGNPLLDMSVGSFLDKFVNKKPKRVKGWKGASLKQPVSETSKSSQNLTEKLLGKGQNGLDVAPTEVFFHHYQVLKGKTIFLAAYLKKEERRITRGRLSDHHYCY